MLDAAYIRKNPDEVRAAIRDKGDKADIDRWLERDERRRAILRDLEPLRGRQNQVGGEVGRLKREKKDAQAEALIKEVAELKGRVQVLDDELKEVEGELDRIALWMPNVPEPEVPPGKTPQDNPVVKTWGEAPKPAPWAKNHVDLYKSAGIDPERGAKITGSAFICYRGPAARLQRSLVNLMMDTHAREHGYTEVWPPFLANRASMTGTGQIPKLEDDMYRTERDDFFPVPTAEVPVTNMHRDEIIPEEALPLTYVAYSPCFRREAGSYGQDTVGLMRVHQFEKVELVKIVRPETSRDEHESLLVNAESILQKLGLHYRVILLCRGDLGFAAAKCYDIEAWAPVTKRWFEVSSVSNFHDFQARRASIRFRTKGDGKVRYCHTLNGSGLALPRVVLCLLETFQQEDGSIRLPEVLHPYFGGPVIPAKWCRHG